MVLYKQPSPPKFNREVERGQEFARIWRKGKPTWVPGKESGPEMGTSGEMEDNQKQDVRSVLASGTNRRQ